MLKSKGIRRKFKRRKKGETRKLKEQLWKLCRILTYKKHGNNCYTCEAKNLQGSNAHTGHFITSSLCSTELRYTLSNLAPQCYRCNIHLSGNWPAFEKHLIADGVDIVFLKKRNEETKGKSYGNEWIRAKIAEYQKLLETVDNEVVLEKIVV